MKNKPLTPWKRFLGLLKLERKDVFHIAYYAVFEGVVALSLPLGIQYIINLLQNAQISTSWIVLVILVSIGVAFSGVLKFMQMRIIEAMQQRIFTRASFELTYRFPKIKMDELKDYYLPELANRFFDTLTIQKSLSKILIDVPSAFLQIVFALVLLSFYHPFFIVFGILLLLLVFTLFRFTAQEGLNTSLKESKYKYKVAHWLQEIARSVISFKASGKTTLALEKNDELVGEYLKSRESHFKVLTTQFGLMIGFKVLVTAGLLVVGGVLVFNQQMNIGQFVASEIIILLVIASVEKLISGLQWFYDVLTAIEKLGLVVDNSLESQEGETLPKDLPLKLELNNVGYSVDSQSPPILSNISFSILPKDRVLITGESGAGKSSLLQILAGILEPTLGRINVNNLDLKSFLINDYRSNLGLSLSEESPFEGTIRENVTFGNSEVTDGQIYKVFDQINLTGFLREQTKGLNTFLKPEGKQIPFTIAKKLVLARSIIKQPKLLILEDPLDQFNNEETQKIISFLASPEQPWSLVVVSNNPIWKQKCNKHISLVNGKIDKITQ
ncbi:peptidase domain-containing ABC transporter [Mangrovimonas aestuarii]|uniref:peptidase domain-containing ABC transporter n=1 Tax=Mangrovimonas aestuarii TaxID=3018443 RepID=UPI002377E71A|nr:ATP-binding cassette domain-containing protein [Mangrovimonas aestuarii]